MEDRNHITHFSYLLHFYMTVCFNHFLTELTWNFWAVFIFVDSVNGWYKNGYMN